MGKWVGCLVVQRFFKSSIDQGIFIFSIDATESTTLGKFVNDCIPVYANSEMKIVMVDGRPSLCLFACVEEIITDTEIR